MSQLVLAEIQHLRARWTHNLREHREPAERLAALGLQTNKLRFIEQVIARLPSEVKGILGHDDYDLGYPHVKANSKLMDKTFACMTPYLKLRRHRPIYCKGLTHTSWYDACEIQVSQGSRFCQDHEYQRSWCLFDSGNIDAPELCMQPREVFSVDQTADMSSRRPFCKLHNDSFQESLQAIRTVVFSLETPRKWDVVRERCDSFFAEPENALSLPIATANVPSSEICVICIEPLLGPDSTEAIHGLRRCIDKSHLFHESCIEGYLRNQDAFMTYVNNACPLCRSMVFDKHTKTICYAHEETAARDEAPIADNTGTASTIPADREDQDEEEGLDHPPEDDEDSDSSSNWIDSDTEIDQADVMDDSDGNQAEEYSDDEMWGEDDATDQDIMDIIS